MPSTRARRSTLSETLASGDEGEQKPSSATTSARTLRSSARREAHPETAEGKNAATDETNLSSTPKAPAHADGSRRKRRNTETSTATQGMPDVNAMKADLKRAAAPDSQTSSSASADESRSPAEKIMKRSEEREEEQLRAEEIMEMDKEAQAQEQQIPPVRTSGRQRRPTARAMEMHAQMQAERRFKMKREVVKTEVIEEENEEVVVDVISAETDSAHVAESSVTITSPAVVAAVAERPAEGSAVGIVARTARKFDEFDAHAQFPEAPEAVEEDQEPNREVPVDVDVAGGEDQLADDIPPGEEPVDKRPQTRSAAPMGAMSPAEGTTEIAVEIVADDRVVAASSTVSVPQSTSPAKRGAPPQPPSARDVREVPISRGMPSERREQLLESPRPSAQIQQQQPPLTPRQRPTSGGISSPVTYAIPATAPLLTTDRSNTRMVKRATRQEEVESKEPISRSYSGSSHGWERRRAEVPPTTTHMRSSQQYSSQGDIDEQQRPSRSYYSQRLMRRGVREEPEPPQSSIRSTRLAVRTPDDRQSRYAEMVHSDQHMGAAQQIIVTEDGEEVIYEPIELEDEEVITDEQLLEEGDEEMVYAEEHMQEMQEHHLQLQRDHKQTVRRIPHSVLREDVDSKRDVMIDRFEGHGDGIGDEDESPPHLVPEEGPQPEEILQMEQIERGTQFHETEFIEGMGEVIRVQSPGGTQQLIQLAPGQEFDGDTAIYMDDNGMIVEEPSQQDLREVEFNFLDNKNICCGLCGEIVPYDLLMNEHLPTQHAEVLTEGSMDLEEIPYEVWLREKLSSEKKHMENGFRSASGYDPSRIARSTRVLRRVSQVRVNPSEMSLAQLDQALKKKMVEKMGRKVPVTLVDKQHARCGICNAVVSLNRKFEVVHLVRHFNAWHPSAHRCAGSWKDRQAQAGQGKPLSQQDFAVIDTSQFGGDNLQCIWCGMFMDADALAMHFSEVHPDDVEVPKCNLCLQELVMNARLTEKYGDDFLVSLPDEHHIRCGKFDTTHTSESNLEKTIEKRLRRLQMLGENGEVYMDEDDEEDDDENVDAGPEAYLNSRMTFGRRSKPKRHFIMPALRQAAPLGSKFVEPITECHWKCKLCKGDILAAVISAGAIKHFRTVHPEQLEHMQYELCKARLERVSDGCMEFVHPQLIECLVCNMTYALHKPYNMCRAIRHLKSKHPDMMPEYAGLREQDKSVKMRKWGRMRNEARRRPSIGGEADGEYVTDPDTIAMLKARYNVEFDKVQAMEGADGERVYVLLGEGEVMDQETAEQLAASIATGEIGFENDKTTGVTTAGERRADSAGSTSEEGTANESDTTARSSVAEGSEGSKPIALNDAKS